MYTFIKINQIYNFDDLLWRQLYRISDTPLISNNDTWFLNLNYVFVICLHHWTVHNFTNFILYDFK